ncbi:unnamed protein product [Rotaria sordida]|uniref:Uncharacterized protein n=2 Tax=Rotaria sordida TaxID=392033 RepID=A0A815DFW2_9BILA|nr:unnamed protein product [Rotaria sordida]CAF4080170.1 unnamed protein product [Rotaria sordida]
MLKSIPQYDFKDIQINNLIIRQEISRNQYEENSNTLTPINHNSSPIVINEHTESIVHNDQTSFIPINTTEISLIPINSIGHSHHKQFASQNNEISFEPQSRLTSTCSTIIEPDNMVDILFKIPYQHNRYNSLLSFNNEENFFLIYLLSSHKLEYLSLNSHQISSRGKQLKSDSFDIFPDFFDLKSKVSC